MSRFVENVRSPDFWLRLFYTLLFAVAWQVGEVLILVVAILQLGYRSSTGAAEPRLTEFGASLSAYAAQIGRYVTQASDQKPWPFMEWPVERTIREREAGNSASVSSASKAEATAKS